jgi:hypothetical protein
MFLRLCKHIYAEEKVSNRCSFTYSIPANWFEHRSKPGPNIQKLLASENGRDDCEQRVNLTQYMLYLAFLNPRDQLFWKMVVFQ